MPRRRRNHKEWPYDVEMGYIIDQTRQIDESISKTTWDKCEPQRSKEPRASQEAVEAKM